jgi:hypothetical protein
MRWTVYEASMGGMKNACKDYSENLGVNGRIILEWMLGK